MSTGESPSQPTSSRLNGVSVADGDAELPTAIAVDPVENAVPSLGNNIPSNDVPAYGSTSAGIMWATYPHYNVMPQTNISTPCVDIRPQLNVNMTSRMDVSGSTASVPNLGHPLPPLATQVNPSASAPLDCNRILHNTNSRGLLQPRTEIVNRVVELLIRNTELEEHDGREGERSPSRTPGGDVTCGEENHGNYGLNPISGELTVTAEPPFGSTVEFHSPTDDHASEPGNRPSHRRGHRLVNTNRHVVLVQGVGGIGKTIVAAMAASHSDVLAHFSDGVCWITVGQREVVKGDRRSLSRSNNQMPHSSYLFYVQTICRQLDLTPRPIFEELVLLAGDNESVRVEKARRWIQNTQQEMSQRLGSKRVLIVLDDMWHEDDMDLFNFSNHSDSKCRLLVTTRLRIPTIDVNTVELSALEESEAIDLLFKESGRFISDGVYDVSEREREAARRVVNGCGRHPMAVRAAGRLVTTMSATFDVMSLSDLEKSIDERGLLNIDAERALLDMLNRSFADAMHGPAEARAIRLCFSSFSTVFSHTDCLRPWVPFRPIYILWNSLLSDKERKVLEHPGQNSAAVVLERLEALGLIDAMTIKTEEVTKATTFYQIHHDMMQHFGESLLSKVSKRSPLTSWLGGIARQESRKLMLRTLHARLVQGLLQDERVQSKDLLCCKWRKEKSDSYYTFVYLPLHLIMAGQLRMAEDTLANADFCECRCSCMGIVKGTEAHVRDVEVLQRQMDFGKKKPRKKQIARKVVAEKSFDAMASHLRNRLCTNFQVCEEIGIAFLNMGKALQRQSLWPKAMIMLAVALDCYRRTENIGDDHPIVHVIWKHINANTLPELALVRRESPSCVRLKHADKLRSMQNTATARHQSDPPPAKESVRLELISHSGMGIVPLGRELFGAWMRISELGIGPMESSIHFEVDEQKRLVRTSDGFVLCCSGVNEGSQMWLLEKSLANKRLVSRFFNFCFVVNADGGISPDRQPDLAVGFGLPRLCLVPRNSPARLILKHGPALKRNTLPKVGHDVLPDVELEGKIFDTELLSHPGQAIVKNKANMVIGSSLSGNRIGIGPIEDSFHLVYDGRCLADPHTGFVMKVHKSKYLSGTGVLLYRNTRRTDTIWEGGGIDLVINGEGSISPMHAPNLAVGAPCIGRTNDVVTLEEKNRAEAEAKKETPPQSKLVRLREMRVFLRASVSLMRGGEGFSRG